MTSSLKLAQIINKYRIKYVSSEFISVRKNSEDKARYLMKIKLGHFDKNILEYFLKLANSEFVTRSGKKYYKINVTSTRFQRAFTGANAKNIIEHLDFFNDWSARIWKEPKSSLEGLLDLFWKTRPIPGAGTSLPTLLLYLRDPSRYNIWLPYTAQGFERLTGFVTGSLRSGADYFRYNDLVNKEVRKKYDLQPQEIDFILFMANKERL